MAGETVGIDIVARLDQFRAELAKIPDIGAAEAKALTGKLSKEIKAAEKAAKDAAKGAKEAKTGFDALDSTAGKVGQSAAKMAGSLSLVSPAAGEAARTLNDLADVGEVAATVGESLGVSMGALSLAAGVVTTALAAGYLGWQLYNDEDEKQAVIAADVASAHEALIPILESTRDATIDLKVATGELSELQGDLERNSIRAHKALLAATEESRKKIAELREEQGSVGTQIVDLAESWAPAWTPLGALVRATTTDSADLQERVDALNGTVSEAIDLTRTDVQVTGEGIKAKGKRKTAEDAVTDSLEAQKRAFDQLVEAAGAENDRIKTLTAGISALVAQADDTNASLLEGEAKIIAARDEEIRKIGEKTGALLLASTTELERDQIVAASKMAINAEEMEAETELADFREEASQKAIDLAQKEADERQRIRNAEMGSYADFFGAIQSLASTASDAVSAKDKAAARTAFAVSKAAGIAQAGVNAAKAVSEAVGSAPPPANIPAIIAATAQGAASIAAVAAVPAPSFNDTPGVMKVGQGGGQTVKFAGGDYFAAAKSPDDLRRRVNDMPFAESSPQSIRVGNRAFDFYMRDTLKANNRLSRSIRGSSRVGHRER